jgi:hypothetical protein
MVPAFRDFLGSFMVVSYGWPTRWFQPPDSKPGYSVIPPSTTLDVGDAGGGLTAATPLRLL